VLPFYFHLNRAQILYLVAFTSFRLGFSSLGPPRFIVVPHYAKIFAGLLFLFQLVLQLCLLFSPKINNSVFANIFIKFYDLPQLCEKCHIFWLGKPNILIFFPLLLQSDGHSFSKMNALGVASIKSTTQEIGRWYDLTPSPFVAY